MGIALLIGGLAFAHGLVSCSVSRPTAEPAQIRPVTAAEAQRLAGIRLTDYQTGHAGVRATIGAGATTIHLSGWVDWRAPFVYLNVMGSAGSDTDGLIQAVPGVVAFRPGHLAYANSATPTSPFPPPPVHAPPTGWQVRAAQPTAPIDILITLLFLLRSRAADDPAQIQAVGSTFVTTDQIGGVPVDVIDGPAIPPSAPMPGSHAPTSSTSSLADHGGQVRYWVDAHSHLLRAAALVNATTGVQVDFDPEDAADPRPIKLLGRGTT